MKLSGTFLFVTGITSLASLILSLPTNDMMNKLPPEVAEILFGEGIGADAWESILNGAESLTEPDLSQDGLMKPEARTFGNLFNFSSIISNAPNDTAAVTLVPLITILASIFNKTG